MSIRNLPRPMSPFIGRTEVLAELVALDERERLVTVLGTSGLGKTRLVVEYAQLQAASRDLVFVDLSERAGLDGLLDAVSAALELSRAPTTAAELAPLLRRRGQLLVILDNFEHLVHLATATVGAWLEACPEARFLATSRERLRLEGERVLELMPLQLQSAGAGESEAVALWCAQRQMTDPHYQPGAEELAVVSEIAARLDGIPLAIELAAARAAVLGPSDVLHRLEQRFELLAHGRRGVGARQATMRGAIDWSWELLQEWERAALAQCSVFRGGFDVAAAEAVIDLSAWPAAPVVLDVIHALRDKSLVRVLGPARGTDSLRLAMFASIRDYAAEKLAEGGELARCACQRRLARHYTALGEHLWQASNGPQAAKPLHLLAAEHDNFVAVTRNGLELGEPSDLEAALDALRCLDLIATTRGPLGAHLELLEHVLAAARRADVAPAVRACGLELFGLTLGHLGRLEAGTAALEEAVELLEDLCQQEPPVADPSPQSRATQPLTAEPSERRRAYPDRLNLMLARALSSLAWLRLRGRELERHQELLERARPMAQRLGELQLEGQIAGSLGAGHKERGQLARAEELYEESLALHRRAGNRRDEGVAYTRLAILYLEHGKLEALREVAERALAIHRELGARHVEALVLMALAAAHHAENRLALAREVYDQALALQRFTGEKRMHGACLGYLGVVELELGEVDAAKAQFDAAQQVLQEAAEERHAALFLAFRSTLESSLGHLERARHLLGRAAASIAAHPDDRIAAVIALARAQLELARERGAGGNPRWALDQAQATLAALRQPSGEHALASRSIDVRIAARLLERAIAGSEVEDENTSVLLVHGRGHWFRPPGAEAVDCRRRHAMRRLLVRLAHQRLHQPGVPLEPSVLLACGWPDERMTAESAQNRLYVTMNRLRGLGLRDILLAEGGGYLLDPRVRLRLVQDEAIG